MNYVDNYFGNWTMCTWDRAEDLRQRASSSSVEHPSAASTASIYRKAELQTTKVCDMSEKDVLEQCQVGTREVETRS